MNLVVDACLFVAEQIVDQPEFAAADEFFDHCVRNGARLYAPTIVLAEVAGAVARITGDSAMGGVSTSRLSHFPKLYLRQVDLSFAELPPVSQPVFRFAGRIRTMLRLPVN